MSEQKRLKEQNELDQAAYDRQTWMRSEAEKRGAIKALEGLKEKKKELPSYNPTYEGEWVVPVEVIERELEELR